MKKIQQITTLLLLFSILFSCSKTSEPEEKQTELILTEVNLVRILAASGAEDIVNNSKYFYSERKLDKIILTNNDESPYEASIAYEGDRTDEYKNVKNGLTDSHFYEYPNTNQIIITNDRSDSYSEYNLEDDKLIQAKFYSDFGELWFIFEFSYNQNSNVESLQVKDVSNNPETNRLYKYTYDDKKPYYKSRGLEYELLSLNTAQLAINQNNTLSMSVYVDEEIIYSETYTYEYNPEGYPIQMETINSENEIVISSTFKYE